MVDKWKSPVHIGEVIPDVLAGILGVSREEVLQRLQRKPAPRQLEFPFSAPPPRTMYCGDDL